MEEAEGLVSLSGPPTKVRVSSVLNRKVKEFGAKNMLDGNSETCWNSDQGDSQFVSLDFGREVDVQKVCIMFQGGFVGQDFYVVPSNNGKSFPDLPEFLSTDEGSKAHLFDPEDCNELQEFEVHLSGVRGIKVIFTKSSDFYGRVTIYSLDVWGKEI